MKLRRDTLTGYRKRKNKSKGENKEGQVPGIQVEKQENEQDCAIDLTQAETPVKKEMKCIIDVDGMIDLTESPVKSSSESETKMEDIELEKRSTVSDMGLQFDIIKDAMRECQEEDRNSDTESAQEPYQAPALKTSGLWT